MTNTAIDYAGLFRARKGVVDFIEVPELHYLVVDGTGAPADSDFADAIAALYAVSYGAHFVAKKLFGDAPKVMPLEALWWGATSWTDPDRSSWHWRALIMQPEPIDSDIVAAAVEGARHKPLPALDLVRFEHWAEGLSAQIMHVGPYSAEGPTIERMHEAIAAAGYQLRGRHHEIYLGDPRRAAPDKLRTILRQPVAV